MEELSTRSLLVTRFLVTGGTFSARVAEENLPYAKPRVNFNLLGGQRSRGSLLVTYEGLCLLRGVAKGNLLRVCEFDARPHGGPACCIAMFFRGVPLMVEATPNLHFARKVARHLIWRLLVREVGV